jgi:hypothetical protein
MLPSANFEWNVIGQSHRAGGGATTNSSFFIRPLSRIHSPATTTAVDQRRRAGSGQSWQPLPIRHGLAACSRHHA